jgi:hypothetical protein
VDQYLSGMSSKVQNTASASASALNNRQYTQLNQHLATMQGYAREMSNEFNSAARSLDAEANRAGRKVGISIGPVKVGGDDDERRRLQALSAQFDGLKAETAGYTP